MPPYSYFRAVGPFVRLLKEPSYGLFQSCHNIRLFHAIDRPAPESALSLLSRLVSAPAVAGASSCVPCGHRGNAQDLGLGRKGGVGGIIEGSLAVCCGSMRYIGDLVRECQGEYTMSRGGACCVYDGLMCLEGSRGRERRNKEMVCECLLSSDPAVEKSLGSNPLVLFRCKDLLSSFFAASSASAAPTLSLEGSSLGGQLATSSGSSDQKKLADRTLKLHSGSCYLPHPDKEETGGEDAHFICDELAIGVADGVGGWAAHGVDSGQYARELMSHAAKAIQEEPKGSIDPVRVLEKAYASTKALGSSTACIIALTNQGLRAVNLGDSGFIVVRDGCTVFRSPVQQHDFNFTYQLESGNASDLPSAAQVFTVAVESGDAIVAGTDGLFDNLYNNEITAVVVHAIRAGFGPQVTAQKIAALARQRALDKNRQTPFSTAAQEAGFRYYGGKLDDITVVVSYVTAFSS